MSLLINDMQSEGYENDSNASDLSFSELQQRVEEGMGERAVIVYFDAQQHKVRIDSDRKMAAALTYLVARANIMEDATAVKVIVKGV